MPSEKFYNHDADEILEVFWGQTEDGVDIRLYSYTLDSEGVPGYTHVLAPDREDLNRMIRSLRRARNAKYGSDE